MVDGFWGCGRVISEFSVGGESLVWLSLICGNSTLEKQEGWKSQLNMLVFGAQFCCSPLGVVSVVAVGLNIVLSQRKLLVCAGGASSTCEMISLVVWGISRSSGKRSHHMRSGVMRANL